MTDNYGNDDDDAEVRCKLRRLTGHGGALESEAHRSPQQFAPRGSLADAVDNARKEVKNSAKLERTASECVNGLSGVFSRANELAGASEGETEAEN